MISKYNIVVMDWVNNNEGNKVANNVYIERMDNGLCIASGKYICYEEYLEITNFEKNPDFRVIKMYDHFNGGLIMLVADDLNKVQYVVDRPL